MFAAVFSGARFFLDIIFPPSARETGVRALAPQDMSVSPQTYAFKEHLITTLMPYRDKGVRDLIWILKYRKTEEAVRLAGGILADYLLEYASESRIFGAQTLILVPIPLSRERLRERGYNQSLIVARQAAREIADKTVLVRELLIRTKNTKAQTSLARNERLLNVHGAFSISPTANLAEVKGAHIVVIDDVSTTGATLAEAAHALKERAPSLSLMALARA